MKKIILFICCLFLLVFTFAQVNPNKTYVNGYYRSNGTYVKGHYRTVPNNTNRDNYTTYPNVNPYTGKKGYIKPDNNGLPVTNFNSNSIPNSNLNLPKSPAQIRYEQIKADEQTKKWNEETQERVKKSNAMFESNGKAPKMEINVDEIMKDIEKQKQKEYDEYWKEVKDIPAAVRPTLLEYKMQKGKEYMDNLNKNSEGFK